MPPVISSMMTHIYIGRLQQVDPHAHALYDAVVVYGSAVNQSLAEGVDPSDRREIARRMFNATYDDRE